MLVTVLVGFVAVRPPTVANTEHRAVTVLADSEIEACLLAAQIVSTHVEMVVSTEVLELTI